MKLSSNLGNALVEIIIVVVVAGIMVIVPLFMTAKGTDDAAKVSVQSATTDFANKIATTGTLTEKDYENFILGLNSLGYAYDAEIIVQVLDENPAKKSSDLKGSEIYYTMFDTQVKEAMPLELKKKDRVTVIVTMKSKNWLENVAGFLAGNSSKDKVIAQESVMITGNPAK